jgi:RNA recognition motif-containing protein
MSGRPKGFGFIEYASEEEAQAAIDGNGWSKKWRSRGYR